MPNLIQQTGFSPPSFLKSVKGFFTKKQKETIDKLENKDYKDIKQADVTRILNKVLPSPDETLKKRIVGDVLNYEEAQGKSSSYLKNKLRGDVKKEFVSVLKDSTFTGKSHRLDDPIPEKKTRDIGKIIESKEEIQKSQQPSKGIVEKLIGMKDTFDRGKAIIDRGKETYDREKKTYNELPGGDIGSKLLFYEFPELQAIDQASKMLGIGWSKEDSEYLHNVLDPRYQGPDKQSFKGRINWVGKLIANPGKWFDVVKEIGVSELKNSEPYKWFKRTFGIVGDKFDNSNALRLQKEFEIRESMPEESPFKAIEPVQRLKTPKKYKETKETEAEYDRYKMNLKEIFSDNTDSKLRLALLKDDDFKFQFEKLYWKYHGGIKSTSKNAPLTYSNLPPNAQKKLAFELDKEVKKVLEKLQVKDWKYDMKYQPSASDPSAGDLIDESGRTLLKEYVNQVDMIDKKMIDFITRGKKYEGDPRTPSIIRSELMPKIQRIRNILKDPMAKYSDIGDAINEIMMVAPKDNDSIPLHDIQKKLQQKSSSSTSTAVSTDTAQKQLTQTMTDPNEKTKTEDDEPDEEEKKKKKKKKKPLTEEEKFYGKDKKNPELRPKLGFMDQQELENTLIGNEEEREITDYTWKVFDLKPINESTEITDQNPDQNAVFDRVVAHFNMRYNATFPMPRVSPEPYLPPLVRKNMRDIYDASKRMIDAYDNKQFRAIHPERTPHFEEEVKDVSNRMIDVLPYKNGVDSFNYRMPQFNERIHSLKNRGRYF